MINFLVHVHKYNRNILIIFLSLLILSACGQKKETPKIPNLDSIAKFLGAVDIYRPYVADSLKYLIPILDSVYISDQKYRYGTNGNDSLKKIMFLHTKEVLKTDSINVKKVSAILDRYGWLGYKAIGYQSNRTICSVIQHSDSVTQERYLPMLKKAVMDHRVDAGYLMLLEDRLAVKRNKCQIYGSQLFYNVSKKRYYLFPIIDPDNIVQRYNLIGKDSVTLKTYLHIFHIEWNLATYKKEIPEVQMLLAKRKSNGIKTEHNFSE